jgi:hypothetical protein
MHFSFPARIFAVLLLANLVAASSSKSSNQKLSKSSSSQKSESQDLSTSPQPPNKKKKSQKSHGHITHRMTLEARTTLLGVEMEDLTAAETIFFEDTWMTAYTQVHTNNDDEIRAFVVQEHPQDRGRQLRGSSSSPAPDSRSLFFSWSWAPKYYYYDVFALFETSCGISCGDDDLYQRKLEDQAETEEEFETVLCDLLRTGTMACFQDIDDCQVNYFEV